MHAKISGLGVFLPERIRENSEWPAEFRGTQTKKYGTDLTEFPPADADECDRLVAHYSASEAEDPFRGARKRRVADDSLSAAQAEANAGARALEDAGLNPTDVDVLLSWAVVPDDVLPPVAPRTAYLLGADRATAVGVDAVCASVPVQLLMASALVESGRAKVVLCTQSHLITKATPMESPASPLIGDAATAFIVSRGSTPSIRTIHSVSHGDLHAGATWVRGREPNHAPWWEAGDRFTPGAKDRDASKKLASRVVHIGRDTVIELCKKADFAPGRVDIFASTQPRRWYPAAIAQLTGLPESAVYTTFEDLAHVGGCGPVVNLLEARRRGALHRGASVLIYGMGAGITRAAALLTWDCER